MFKKEILAICKNLLRKFITAAYLFLFDRKSLYDRLSRYKMIILPQENDPWRFESEVGRIQNTLLFQGMITNDLLADLEKVERKIISTAGNKISSSRNYTLIRAVVSIKNSKVQ
jgi:hypothetical protein